MSKKRIKHGSDTSASLEPIGTFTDDRQRVDRLIRLPEVKRISGLGRSSIYHLKSQGLFPECVKISLRNVAWSENSLKIWVSERLTTNKDALKKQEEIK